MYKKITITLILAMILLSGCSGEKKSSETGQAVVAIRSQVVQQTDFPVTIQIGGTLRGDRQTAIPAKVQTTVVSIPVSRGRVVHKGELLVMLDPGGVQSQYHQAEAVFLNAEKQFKQMQSLFESGAVSESQRDGAETEFKVAQANFNAARQAIEEDAPFDGVVTDVYVRAGDEVSPGTPLVEVADVGALRLVLEVPGSQIGLIKTGQTVSIISSVDSSIVMMGQVTGVADAANNITRSFEVECHFAHPSQGFAPGMYVIATVQIQVLPMALVVPSDALMYRTGEAFIYAVSADTVGLLPVTVLATDKDRAAVSGGLQAGQRVVVLGQKNLTPGTKVREAAL